MGETSGCSANSLKSKVVPAWCNPRTNNPSVLWNTAIVAEVVSFLERPSVENESPVAASVLSRLSEGLEEQTNNAVASSMAPGFLRSRMSTSSFAMMFPGAAARSPKTFDNCHVEVSRLALYARNTTNNICLTTFARVSDYNFLDTKSRNHVTPSELSKQRGSFQVKLVTFLCTEEGQNEL